MTWATSAGATSYEYCFDVTDDSVCSPWINTGISSNAVVTGLLPDTTYYWQVRASNGGGTTLADGGAWWNFKTEPASVPVTLTSVGAQDGWVLETSESGNRGGTLDAKSTTFNVGDDTTKKQVRGILSFSTGAAIPDTAVITKITLKIKKQGVVGTGDPFKLLQGLIVDIKNGFFGTSSGLSAADFQAAASSTYGPFSPVAASNTYSIDLTSAKDSINTLATSSGLTQIRLRFNLDDNNNAVSNYVKFYSGNYSTTSSRPTLVIEYYLP
jgi:hypothetical protein